MSLVLVMLIRSQVETVVLEIFPTLSLLNH